MLRARDLMRKDIPGCSPEDGMDVPARLMWEHACGSIPVVDVEQRPRAMITDRDICMAAMFSGKPIRELRVGSAMSKELFTVHEDDGLLQAERLMRDNNVHRLPVVDAHGVLVGVLSLTDLAKVAARDLHHPRRNVSVEEVAVTLAGIRGH